MVGFIIGLAAGLLIGWTLLPEPAFVRGFFERMGWAKPAATTTSGP